MISDVDANIKITIGNESAGEKSLLAFKVYNSKAKTQGVVS